MTQRTIYLLNALGLVALVGLNAIDVLGLGKAILIPAAWFIGAWYGRMDEQATWSRLLGEKVKEAMPTRVDWVNTNAPAQPARVMGFDMATGPDQSVRSIGVRRPDGLVEFTPMIGNATISKAQFDNIVDARRFEILQASKVPMDTAKLLEQATTEVTAMCEAAHIRVAPEEGGAGLIGIEPNGADPLNAEKTMAELDVQFAASRASALTATTPRANHD